jgi:thiol-disulfide isomerase/thioredoxin
MTRRSWTAVIVLLVLALATIWGARTFRTRFTAQPRTDASAAAVSSRPVRLFREPLAVPAFSITDLQGRTHSSSEWAGKVVLLNFWATWCPPCRAEIPDLIALQNKYRDKLVIVGISEDEGPVDAVKKFVADTNMTYLVAMSTPELRKIFRGVVALPTTFVLDPQGRVQQKHVGLLNTSDAEAEARVLVGLDTHASIERIENSDKVRLENAAQAKAIPGVDLNGLSDAERKAVVQALLEDDCTCGCGLTVAECRLDDPDCPVSLPLAREIVKKKREAH